MASEIEKAWAGNISWQAAEQKAGSSGGGLPTPQPTNVNRNQGRLQQVYMAGQLARVSRWWQARLSFDERAKGMPWLCMSLTKFILIWCTDLNVCTTCADFGAAKSQRHLAGALFSSPRGRFTGRRNTYDRCTLA